MSRAENAQYWLGLLAAWVSGTFLMPWFARPLRKGENRDDSDK